MQEERSRASLRRARSASGLTLLREASDREFVVKPKVCLTHPSTAVPLLGNQHSLKAFVWAKSDSTVFAWIGFLQVQSFGTVQQSFDRSIIEHANENYNSVSPVLLPFGNV